jgi:hypothetical protein
MVVPSEHFGARENTMSQAIDNVAGFPVAGDQVGKRGREQTVQMTFRLPADLVDRLDAHAERLKDATGVDITRTDVVKLAIARGLEVLERPPSDG